MFTYIEMTILVATACDNCLVSGYKLICVLSSLDVAGISVILFSCRSLLACVEGIFVFDTVFRRSIGVPSAMLSNCVDVVAVDLSHASSATVYSEYEEHIINGI